jgi:hypothetical protein
MENTEQKMLIDRLMCILGKIETLAIEHGAFLDTDNIHIGKHSKAETPQITFTIALKRS